MGNTYHNTKVYFSPTASPAGKYPTKTEYEAVTDWVEFDDLISSPSLGSVENFISQNLLSQDIESSSKGVATAGGGDLVAQYDGESANQEQWRVAGETKTDYMMKQEMDDAPSATMTNTIGYAYGQIGRQRKVEASSPDDFANLIQPIKLNSHETAVRPTTA